MYIKIFNFFEEIEMTFFTVFITLIQSYYLLHKSLLEAIIVIFLIHGKTLEVHERG